MVRRHTFNKDSPSFGRGILGAAPDALRDRGGRTNARWPFSQGALTVTPVSTKGPSRGGIPTPFLEPLPRFYAKLSEATFPRCEYPLSGDGVEIDPKEVLVRS